MSFKQQILEIMKKEYIEKGFMYSGSIGIHRLERIVGDGKKALDLIFDMVKEGLVERRKCEALAFELPAEKRLELIKKHNLAVEWEKTGRAFYPNSPYGEVTSVYRKTDTPLPLRPYSISKKGKPLY